MVVNVRGNQIVGSLAGGNMERSSPPVARIREEKKTSFMISDILDASPRSSKSQCRLAECCSSSSSSTGSRMIVSPVTQREWSPEGSEELHDNLYVDEEQKELHPQSPSCAETDTASSQDSHGRCKQMHTCACVL